MLGDAKKKIQRMVDLAEQLYEKVNELTRRVEDTTEAVEDTNARIGELETELAEHRAILEAIAEDRGIDVEAFAGGDGENAGDGASPTDPGGNDRAEEGRTDGEHADA
jgi:hypothetical protein